jgi:hypothetical protein
MGMGNPMHQQLFQSHSETHMLGATTIAIIIINCDRLLIYKMCIITLARQAETHATHTHRVQILRYAFSVL